MQLDSVTLQIGKRKLLSELSLSLEPGQCWLVVGRNGAGKSTLLRAMAGLRKPDGGSIAIDGRAVADWPLAELARARAYLPQGRNDAFSYTVREAVLTARHPYHEAAYWESNADQAAAQEAMAKVGVMHLAERDLRSLSGGERQRVAIAAVLAQDARLLLLDEPANALDLAHQVAIGSLLRQLRAAGKTVVMVSHDLNLAHEVASHALLLLEDGKWQAGPVSDVMQAPLLSQALGHAVEAIEHGSRTIFMPVMDDIA